MANKVQLKKSSVAARVPLTTDVDYGELALNYTDGKLYYKKSDGTTIDYFPSVAYVPLLSGSYANPTWITSLDSSKLTGTIDNARLNGGTYSINVTGTAGAIAWSGVTGKPTTLSGYGITDAYSSSNPSGYITSAALSSYLPLAGGTLSGTVTLNSGRIYATSAASTLTYGAPVHIRDNEANGSNSSYASIAFSSGPGADFSIGKYTNVSAGYLQIRNNNNTQLWTMDSAGNITQAGTLSATGSISTSSAMYVTGQTVLHAGNYSSYAQATLVSGTNIKTVNGASLLGSGDLTVSASTANSLLNFTAAYSANPINPDSPPTLDAVGYCSNISLFGQSDGGLYSSAYSTSWYHQIFGDFRTGQLAIRGKNSGTWQAWRTVLDSSNVSSYAVQLNTWVGSSLIHTDGRHYGTIFYDSNNSAYYCDPNSRSNFSSLQFDNSNLYMYQGDGTALRIQTAYGWMNLGAQNSSWTHMYADRPFYTNQDWYVNGNLIHHDGNASRARNSQLMYYQGFTLDANTMDPNSTGFTYAVNAPAVGPITRFSTGGGYDMWLNSSYGNGNTLYFRTRQGDAGTLNSWKALVSYGINYSGSLYGNTLYDSDDTGYYIDPNSTSATALRMRGGALFGPNPNWGTYLYVGGNGDYDSGQAQVFTTNGNLHLEPKAGYQIYLSHYRGGWFRAYGWYDNDDTGYYIDPNSTSRMATVNGNDLSSARFSSNQGNQNPNSSHPGYGIRPFYSWNTGQAYNDTSGYSNGITIGSHPGDQGYGFQLVQNMWDDATYTRRYNGGWQSWRKLQWINDWMGSSLIHEDGRHYATIMYDSNNSAYYCDPNGTSRMGTINADSLYSYGNVTAYSDENLKTDWEDLPQDYIEQLAKVKSGKYTRIDTKERQAGVGAQSFKNILPEVVIKNGEYLGVNYGNAALVSAVELAKRVVEQDARIARLEELISKLIDN
jgi:hypothetical protein